MANGNRESDPRPFIRTILKSRQVEYYPVSEEELRGIKGKGVLGEVFLSIAALLWSACIAVILTKYTSVTPPQHIPPLLSVLSWVFLGLAVVFSVLAACFIVASFSSIKGITTTREPVSSEPDLRKLSDSEPAAHAAQVEPAQEHSQATAVVFETVDAALEWLRGSWHLTWWNDHSGEEECEFTSDGGYVVDGEVRFKPHNVALDPSGGGIILKKVHVDSGEVGAIEYLTRVDQDYLVGHDDRNHELRYERSEARKKRPPRAEARGTSGLPIAKKWFEDPFAMLHGGIWLHSRQRISGGRPLTELLKIDRISKDRAACLERDSSGAFARRKYELQNPKGVEEKEQILFTKVDCTDASETREALAVKCDWALEGNDLRPKTTNIAYVLRQRIVVL